MSEGVTAIWSKVFHDDLWQPSPTLLTTSPEFLMESQWKEALKVLTRLAYLEPDWDGEDAEAPDTEIIDSCIALFIELSRRGMQAPTRVEPTPEGGLIVEWGSPNYYLEVEIGEPFRGEVMAIEGDAPAIHWPVVWSSADGDPSRTSAEWSTDSEFSYGEPTPTWKHAATA